MTSQRTGRTKPLPLVLGEESFIPLYQQLVHQIRHLITSREIAASDRLPSVRDLAQELGINPGTVVLAYRTLHAEGLVETRRGRGTFVVPVDTVEHSSDRHNALQRAVDQLLDRADALGFDAASVHQSLVARAQRQRRLPFAVVMLNQRGAEKYARQISEEVPEGVVAEPRCLTLAALTSDPQTVMEKLQPAYLTFTFMSYVPTVEARLAELGIEAEVVGITSQLTPQTVSHLWTLDPKRSYSLVGGAHSVSVGLNILARFSNLDLSRITVFTEHDSLEVIRAASPDMYLHTLNAGPRLDELGVPAEKRLELQFCLSTEARHRVSRLFNAGGTITRAEESEDIVLDG